MEPLPFKVRLAEPWERMREKVKPPWGADEEGLVVARVRVPAREVQESLGKELPK
jgi:hypothetical protein